MGDKFYLKVAMPQVDRDFGSYSTNAAFSQIEYIKNYNIPKEDGEKLSFTEEIKDEENKLKMLLLSPIYFGKKLEGTYNKEKIKKMPRLWQFLNSMALVIENKTGTKTKNVLIKENLDIWTDKFKKEIYQICREMVELEDKFLDLVFEMGDLQGLTKKDMYAYNRYIADRRLLQLGLKTNYDQRENPLGWIDEVTGVEHQNFFEGRVTDYNASGLSGNIDWNLITTK